MNEHLIKSDRKLKPTADAFEPTIRTSVPAKVLQPMVDRHFETVEALQSYLLGDDWHRWLNIEINRGEIVASLSPYGERLLIAQIVATELAASGADPDASVGGRF